MVKKVSSALACLTVFLIMTSCVEVSHGLDLDKDLSLDIRLAPGGIDVPIGTLDTIHVDSLFHADNEDPDALFRIFEHDVLGYRGNDVINSVRVRIPGFQTTFDGPDMPAMETAFSAVTEDEEDISFWSYIESSASVCVTEEIDGSILSISRLELSEPAAVDVSICFSGVPSKVSSIDIDTMHISFPEYVELEYRGNDPRISFDPAGHVMTVRGTVNGEELSSGEIGFAVDGFEVTGMAFAENPVVKRDGKTFFQVDESPVSIEGLVSIHDRQLKVSELQGLKVVPKISVSTLSVGHVEGKFNPELETVCEALDIALDEDLDFLSDKNSFLELDNIQLAVRVNTNVPVPVYLDMSMSSLDSDGEYICRNLVPDNGRITIPGCPEDMDNQTVTVFIYNNNDIVAHQDDDTVFVYVSRLAEIAARIPERVEFTMQEELYHDRDYRISMVADYGISGEYELTVPFEFSQFTVCYSDTIDGIAAEIDDFSEYVENVDATLSAIVVNTIPLGIDVDMFAIDSSGNVLDGVSFGRLSIPAGNNEADDGNAVRLKVDMVAGALEKLDGIVFTACCSALQDGGRKALKRTDFLHIRDMVLSLEGGVDVDLTKENER
ncbi:MAG: hypothetical protein MJZ06_00370 [Bacteroidaceae bacterium]|nr:hypothetical protein [Bacteroidaceae bacterium]